MYVLLVYTFQFFKANILRVLNNVNIMLQFYIENFIVILKILQILTFQQLHQGRRKSPCVLPFYI